MNAKRPLLSVIGVATVTACASSTPSGPYVGARLTRPAYIELAGTPAQIADVKAHAATNEWTIDCEGKAGNEATLRLRFPPATSQSEIEDYFADVTHPRAAKAQMIYNGMRKYAPGCATLP